MNRLRISFQIALSLALLSTSIFVLAQSMGFLEDPDQVRLESRMMICENLAVQTSQLINLNQTRSIKTLMERLAERNPSIRSAALKRADGAVLATVGDHPVHWKPLPNRRSTPEQVFVPIVMNSREWGAIEVAFAPLHAPTGPLGWLPPVYQLTAFLTAANALAFIFYLRRTLYELDPQKSVPNRVRSALDTLAEGLLILDTRGRIVMANRAFASIVGQDPSSLQGQPATAMKWESEALPPWEEVLAGSTECKGVALRIADANRDEKCFIVNAAIITDDRGTKRGVLASFGDVTELERKKVELLNMLATVEASRERISRQNEQLTYLATRDPLTGCLNRRAYFEQFESFWEAAQEKSQPISCIMVDADHFKSVNDRFGHSMGDEVLRRIASTLISVVGCSGLVCRYGGEEFCVLLPGGTADITFEAAERLRESIGKLVFEGFKVTASLGVSSNQLGAQSAQEMLDQADKCLYFAKRNGRNQVAVWNKVPHDLEIDPKKITRAEESVVNKLESSIPFSAASALLAALNYRDFATAAHCQRVADLAVVTARGLVTAHEAYLIEIAALLHDIGKIGVPDSILLKSTPFTDDEWLVMRSHTSIGAEIVNAAFQSPALLELVQLYPCRFSGDASSPNMPKGNQIPLGARIIAVCDAFDSMVSEHSYRATRSSQDALEELARLAGDQFDPEIVDRLTNVISNRPDRRKLDGTTSRQIALSLGQQVERLARAVDNKDFDTVRTCASHLQATASKHQVSSIEITAKQLMSLSSGEADLSALVQSVHELLEVCLDAQRAALETPQQRIC